MDRARLKRCNDSGENLPTLSIQVPAQSFEKAHNQGVKYYKKQGKSHSPGKKFQQEKSSLEKFKNNICKEKTLSHDSQGKLKIEYSPIQNDHKFMEMTMSMSWLVPLDSEDTAIEDECLDLSLQIPTKSFDEDLRKEIKRHIRRYNGLFSEKGLQQTEAFITQLEKLIHNQVLLRSDTQNDMNIDFTTLQKDILSIARDYHVLKLIASSTSDLRKVNDGLLEILKSSSEESLNIGVMNANRFDRQVYAINFLRFEVGQFAQGMRNKLRSFPTNSPPQLYESIINLQTLLYEFLLNHKKLFHEIELERMGFSFMMRRFCEVSRKDILFNSALNELEEVIALYIKASKGEMEKLEDTVSQSEGSVQSSEKKEKKGTSFMARIRTSKDK